MIEPEDYDPEVDGECLCDTDADGIEDDERWDENETSDEFLK